MIATLPTLMKLKQLKPMTSSNIVHVPIRCACNRQTDAQTELILLRTKKIHYHSRFWALLTAVLILGVLVFWLKI